MQALVFKLILTSPVFKVFMLFLSVHYYAYLTVACICDKQVSKGLWKKYGDGRVKDTPITEVGKHVAIVISNCQVQNNA